MAIFKKLKDFSYEISSLTAATLYHEAFGQLGSNVIPRRARPNLAVISTLSIYQRVVACLSQRHESASSWYTATNMPHADFTPPLSHLFRHSDCLHHGKSAVITDLQGYLAHEKTHPPRTLP